MRKNRRNIDFRWDELSTLERMLDISSVNLVHVFISFIGYKATLRLLNSMLIFDTPNTVDGILTRGTTRSILLYQKKLKKSRLNFSNCLSRSLFIWFKLKKIGVDGTLHIGTSFDLKDLKAHAWLEIEGIPITAGRKVRRKFRTFNHNFLNS